MKHKIDVVVMGGGVAGLSAAYHIKKKYPNSQVVVYEKSGEWGGLCGGFYVDSPRGKFWFDIAPHLSFASDKYVQDFFQNSSKPYRHIPDPENYYQNIWLKHPVQNNLYALPADTKVKVIKDMLQNSNKKENIKNFAEWLKVQYGNFFAENFPFAYTRKYWTAEAEDLSVNPVFVGPRFYIPNTEEILFGAMSEDTPVTYYAKEMRYPKEGQYRSFFKDLMEGIEITYNKEVIEIDPKNKEIICQDGTKTQYNKLVSTLPLPLMANLIVDAPQHIKEQASNLHATSAALVSFGFGSADIPKNLWFYVYDEDKLFARVYSPSCKSPSNAPDGCSSLQAEIYFSKLKPLESMIGEQKDIPNYLISHVKEKFVEMGICKSSDIVCEDFRILPFGNVIFTHGMEESREVVLNFVESKDILTCGRFGEWDYLWSDQSFLSGMKVAERIKGL